MVGLAGIVAMVSSGLIWNMEESPQANHSSNRHAIEATARATRALAEPVIISGDAERPCAFRSRFPDRRPRYIRSRAPGMPLWPGWRGSGLHGVSSDSDASPKRMGSHYPGAFQARDLACCRARRPLGG